MRAAGGLAVLLAAAACAPMTVAEAERLCLNERAPAGTGARVDGTARFGASFGPEGARLERRMGVDITVGQTSGVDAEAAWRSCVFRNTGQPPTRPFPG